MSAKGIRRVERGRQFLAVIGLGDDDDAFFIRLSHQRPVDAGETLLLDFRCQAGSDLLLGVGPGE